MALLAKPSLTRREQIFWLAAQARKRIPDWSYIANMYDFVKAEYEANPDKDNWEQTRDKVAQRYQYEVNADYNYRYPWDSGINFAASMVSLFYGEGDYKKTIRIGCMSGWDSDNPTSTWGGLLGFLYGHKGLQKHFEKKDFSDDYFIGRSRYNLPISTDNFTDMAHRGINIINSVVVEEMNGSISNNNWIIPINKNPIKKDEHIKTIIPWILIEDTDTRWNYIGFKTKKNQWNASGGSLTFGYKNCKAKIKFKAKAVQYYGYRSPKGGKVKIILDGKNFGEFNLKTDVSEYGQYYVKIFEQENLADSYHTLEIIGDESSNEKTIDMLSIIP